jgi:redox-sensitive bicupin YhaK (pirin superfamily)
MLALAGLHAQTPTAGSTDKPVIDNDRVTVWDVKLAPGESGPSSSADFDSVILFLEGGQVRTTRNNDMSSVAVHAFGDAVFVPKGSHATDTVVSGQVHEVVIALKGHHVPPNEGPPGIPHSFPRPGAEKMFENDQAIAWKFSWTPGVPVPMHHHDKDTIMVFRYDGPVRSTDPAGQQRILPFAKGQILYSKAGTTHTETLIGERQSAVDLELK